MFLGGGFLQELQLIQKTNNDWWSARRANGQEGYVPANYVKEIEPKVVQKVVKRPVRVPVTVKVEKSGMRKELRKKDKTGLRRTPSGIICLLFIHIFIYYVTITCVHCALCTDKEVHRNMKVKVCWNRIRKNCRNNVARKMYAVTENARNNNYNNNNNNSNNNSDNNIIIMT